MTKTSLTLFSLLIVISEVQAQLTYCELKKKFVCVCVCVYVFVAVLRQTLWYEFNSFVKVTVLNIFHT